MINVIRKLLIISYISLKTPYDGFPIALNVTKLIIPEINPKIVATTAAARANGNTGIDFNSFNVPLIRSNSNLILATLVAI